MPAANDRLLAIYERHWSDMKDVTDGVDRCSGPHLIRVPEGLGDGSVAVIGQQTKGWDWADSARAQMELYPADGIVSRKRGTPFWRAARKVTRSPAARRPRCSGRILSR